MFVRVCIRICDRRFLAKGKKTSFWRFKWTIINFYNVLKYFWLALLSSGHLETFDFDTETRAIFIFIITLKSSLTLYKV